MGKVANPFEDVRKFHAEDGVVGVIAVVEEAADEHVSGWAFIPGQTGSFGPAGVTFLEGVGRGDGPRSWAPLD